MSDQANEGLLEMVSHMIGKNFQEMDESQKKFQAEMERNSCESREKFDQAANSLFGKRAAKVPQYRPEVLEIANTLQSLPVMVPVVQHVIMQYMLEVQKAGETVKQRFGVTETPAEPSAQQPPNGVV